jgi:hypothetical protein
MSVPEGEKTMSKVQRGNKEAKKPKKPVPAKPAAPGAFAVEQPATAPRRKK